LTSWPQDTDFFNDQYHLFWTPAPNSKTYVIQSAGNFLTMVITNVNGDTAIYSTDATASIIDAAAAGFTLYPNPSSDFLNIQFDQNRNVSQIMIYDLAGRMVMSTKETQNRIDTASLTSSNYMLQVTFENGSQGGQRFVKE
jgi:hypothetical protein